MPQISAIKSQKKKGYYNIYLGGKFAFALDEVTLAKEKLEVGQNIGAEDISRLRGESELNKLLAKVLRFLSYRPRSEREIRNYLFKKTSTKEIGEEIIKRLRELNYIDDRAFATWWLEQRERQKKGKRLIRNDLFRKGIAKEIIEEVEEAAGEDEYGRAREAARRRLERYKKFKGRKAKQKVWAFLTRNGFSWEVIEQVIQDIF